MADFWVENSFVISSYSWQFSNPTDAEFIRIRSELINYPKKLYPNFGHICQGNKDNILNFQRLYSVSSYGQIFLFPNYGIFPQNDRRIGILGQRLWDYGDPPLTWIVHIDTFNLNLLPTLPDNQAQKLEMILQILQSSEGGLNLTNINKMPPQLL